MLTEIRLACVECDRTDFDGIASLNDAPGWQYVERIRSHEEACRTYFDPDLAPFDFDVTGWFTHLGFCPECLAERAKTYGGGESC